MSVDEHAADGAHTHDYVTQQEVSASPYCLSMSDCTSQQRCHYPGQFRDLFQQFCFFFFLSLFYPLDIFTQFNGKKVLAQFLFNSTV